MDSASPNKRRALASLDANTMSPLPRPHDSKLSPSQASFGNAAVEDCATRARLLASRAPAGDQQEAATAKKRTLEGQDTSSEGKRSRVAAREEDDMVHHSRSASPDESSFFDTTVSSAGEGDSSWTTNITEPDLAPVVNLRRRVPLTREQAREKAEMLKARLGLASYKVRTGQTTVSFAQLEAKQSRAAGCRSVSGPSPISPAARAKDMAPETSGHDREAQQQDESVVREPSERADIANNKDDAAMLEEAHDKLKRDHKTHVDTGGGDGSTDATGGLLNLARSASEMGQMGQTDST